MLSGDVEALISQFSGHPVAPFVRRYLERCSTELGLVVTPHEFGDRSLDRKVFINRLEQVSETRNDVMDFNPDPVTPEDLEEVRLFLQVLREVVT